MKFYADNGVDSLIAPHLPEFGYACDVGSNNGLFASNTKHFEDKGWLVLCVEPNPRLAIEGRANRKLWRQVACGSEDRASVSFEIVGVYPYASFSGFHPAEAPEPLIPGHWKQAVHNTTKIIVEMKTLNTLLKEAGFPRLDLLTVDVEGHELEVLHGIDLKQWTPKVIIAEAWDEAHKVALVEHLKPLGYTLDAVREFDCCFGRHL